MPEMELSVNIKRCEAIVTVQERAKTGLKNKKDVTVGEPGKKDLKSLKLGSECQFYPACL